MTEPLSDARSDGLCLTLICPPHMEEKLLDLLLSDPGTELFTSTPTFGHGLAASRLSASEQVMGRSRAVQVNVLLDAARLNRLQERLGSVFAGTGLRWWVTPVIASGELT